METKMDLATYTESNVYFVMETKGLLKTESFEQEKV